MLALWGVPERPGRASNRTSDQLCRIYLAFSLGLLQPLFCLLALLLCQSSLRHTRMARSTTVTKHNCHFAQLTALQAFNILVVPCSVFTRLWFATAVLARSGGV